MSESPVLGIDFGTSNTAAAWVDAKSRVRVVPVREGVYLLPSVAWYSDRGDALIGDAARQQLIEDPTHTIHGLKRFIGRRWTSPFVHRHKDHFGYRMVEGSDGLVAVDLFGKPKSLEAVSVDILKRIAELASASLREPVKECTLTVPAHFGFSQRQAIRSAAMKAGLVVKAMVNEPTAAAMYYARKKGNDGTVLIFDLGGGTFDATLLAIMGGVVKVLATGGDAFLGGQDFDGRIVEHLAARFERDHGIDLRPQTVALWRLFVAAETAKVALSAQDEARVRVPCVTVKDDRFLDLDYVVTRKELEELTAPLIEKCLGICEDILSRARSSARDVDEIVFVGGQTRMPAIQRRLAQVFHSNPAKHIHPDLGVAVGAALLGRGDQSLIDVVSSPLGVMVPGVGARELIPANTTVPSVKRLSLGMRPRKGQPLIMAIYESPDAASLEREHLGTMRADAAWLDENEGDLELEAWIGDDLSLSLSLKAGSGRLPLVIDRPQAVDEEPPRRSDGSASSDVDEVVTAPDLGKVMRKAQNAEDASTNVDPPGAPAAHSRRAAPSSGAKERRGPLPPGFKSIDVGFANESSTGAHSLGNVSQRAQHSQMAPPALGGSTAAASGSRSNRPSPHKLSSNPPPVGGAAAEGGRRVGESTGGISGGVRHEESNIPAAGDMVGSYRLLDVIGKGGMGRVYLAEHTVLGRKVALKMLRKRFSDNRQAVERFITEARAVNQIRHDNIIQITDFIESDDGHTCYIMELLEGQSVAEMLQSVDLPASGDALTIAFQVADAMVAVHDAQIIHRDLKPENIFLVKQPGSELFVKLLDFGVAKLVDNEGRSLHETGLGDALGTPEYMSPEQLVGGRVDHRSDIYSLGVVLYEMVTGQKPFDVDASMGEVVFQQITQAPVPPSQRVPTSQIPPALEELVLQCLEKEPSKRPRSMREVRGRLEALLERRVSLQRTTKVLQPTPQAPWESDKTVNLAVNEFDPKTVITDPTSMDLVLLPGEILATEASTTSRAPLPAYAQDAASSLRREERPTPDLPSPAPARGAMSQAADPRAPVQRRQPQATVHVKRRAPVHDPEAARRRNVAITAGIGAAVVLTTLTVVGLLLGKEEPPEGDVTVAVLSREPVAPAAAAPPSSPSPSPSSSPSPSPVRAPTAAAATTTATPPSPPARVRITFDSTPPGAGVYLPGKDRRLGVTPFTVQVQPSRSPQDFEFRLEGHAPLRETLQPPTGDFRFHVELQRP